MFSRTPAHKSAQSLPEQAERLRYALDRADAVVIGAGAGLSASAGFSYSGERFEKYFGDFREKYGIRDMYSGGFYPFPSLEEYWAWWSRQIMINRYGPAPVPVYNELLSLLDGLDCFVLTTNVDHQFQLAGFDKKRLFYTQGDYGLFQCSEPCCQETWDNAGQIRSMAASQRDMRIPTELIPRCPRCGKPMTTNLRCDGSFVQDEGWHRACGRCQSFLRRHRGGKILYLELGAGMNTPAIIKYPFWKMTAANPEAVYACVNSGEAFCPPEIKKQSVCINADIAGVLSRLVRRS